MKKKLITMNIVLCIMLLILIGAGVYLRIYGGIPVGKFAPETEERGTTGKGTSGVSEEERNNKETAEKSTNGVNEGIETQVIEKQDTETTLETIMETTETTAAEGEKEPEPIDTEQIETAPKETEATETETGETKSQYMTDLG